MRRVSSSARSNGPTSALGASCPTRTGARRRRAPSWRSTETAISLRCGSPATAMSDGAPGPSTRNAVRNTLGVYKTPLIEVSTKCVFTNTTPVGAYRGAGRPEANYYMERLVDTAAREMGIDQVELRRRNHIPAEAMPY